MRFLVLVFSDFLPDSYYFLWLPVFDRFWPSPTHLAPDLPLTIIIHHLDTNPQFPVNFSAQLTLYMTSAMETDFSSHHSPPASCFRVICLIHYSPSDRSTNSIK